MASTPVRTSSSQRKTCQAPLPEELMEIVNHLSNHALNTSFGMFENDDDKENDLLVRSTLEAEKSSSQQEKKWEGSRLRGPATGASSR